MPIGTRLPGWTRRVRTLAWIACSAAAAVHPQGSVADEPLRLVVAEEPHMGLVVRISAYFPLDASPPTAFRAAYARVAELAAKFSTYREDSELRLVEDVAWREPVLISPEFAFLLGHALRLARDSGGAFDPTLGNVTRLFRAKDWQRAGPPDRTLAEAWSRTGWKRVELHSSSRMLSFAHRGVQLDLGGIAKGYVADEALAEMQRAGVTQAMVAVAGDIAVGDPPPNSAGWRIGLDGVGPRGSVEQVLLLANRGVSTSGGRERNFRVGDQLCSHILTKVDSGCTDTTLAVSVVAESAMEADGVATALVALGPKRSNEFLNMRPGVSAYWSARTSADESPATQTP